MAASSRYIRNNYRGWGANYEAQLYGTYIIASYPGLPMSYLDSMQYQAKRLIVCPKCRDGYLEEDKFIFEDDKPIFRCSKCGCSPEEEAAKKKAEEEAESKRLKIDGSRWMI